MVTTASWVQQISGKSKSDLIFFKLRPVVGSCLNAILFMDLWPAQYSTRPGMLQQEPFAKRLRGFWS